MINPDYDVLVKSVELPVITTNSILENIDKFISNTYKENDLNLKIYEIYDVLGELIELSTLFTYYVKGVSKIEKYKTSNAELELTKSLNLNNKIKEKYEELMKKISVINDINFQDDKAKEVIEIKKLMEILKKGYERYKNEFYEKIEKLK
jgi:hypothetical protein